MRRVRVRPSKASSTAGFIGGIIFIFIGIGFAIPTFGEFGILWTLFAIIITVTNAINAFGTKGVASYEIETDMFESNKANESNDFAKKLRDLEKLKVDGLISLDEYERKRQEILDDKW